ncbi:MAG: ABC transporter permease [Deltaproteobacteria bacterium]|nr:ABC transporter permease [Deltaproteobacteria bacterium]
MGPLKLARMAWSNLWRQRRRTIITISSIAFACFLAVFMIGLNDGSWGPVIDTAARIGGGHVTVQHPDYQDKPALNRTVTGTGQLVERLRSVPHVSHVLPRIVGQAMLSTTSESMGAGFVAYDPAQEGPATLSILDAVSAGELFKTADDRGIILGWRLARNLGAELGTKVVYTLTDKKGEIVSGLARVSGLVRTNSPAVDLGLCFLPIGAVRRTLGYAPDEAVQVAVFVDNYRRSDEVAAAVKGVLDDKTTALTWKESQPDLDTFIIMKRGGGAFFSALILILCAAGIFNTLFVSVMERLREFGVLMAIGFNAGRLFGLVMLESLWLGLIGLVAGAILLAGPYYYLSTVGLDLTKAFAAGEQQADIAGVAMSMVVKMDLHHTSAIAIASIVMGATLLSGLYPAWKAGRVEPVESIKLV